MQRKGLVWKVFLAVFFLIMLTGWPAWTEFSDGFNFPVGPNGHLNTGNYQQVVEEIDKRLIGLAEGYSVPWAFGVHTSSGLHLGDDWNGTCGGNNDFAHRVYAVSNGEVIYATDLGNGESHAWGKVVIIRHEAPSQSRGFKRHSGSNAATDWTVDSQYAHLESVDVMVGDQVKKGQVIGTLGDGNGYYSSCSSPDWKCAHLHFEIRHNLSLGVGSGYSFETNGWLDPTVFIKANRIIFRDVPRELWAYPYVEKLVTHRVVSGERNTSGELTGLFNPERAVTRAEFVKMVLLGAGIAVPEDPGQVGGTPFVDVSVTHPLFVYVQTAKNRGIVSGVDGTNYFQPDEATLRCEACKMVVLAFGLSLVTGFALSDYFTDVEEYAWYSDYLRTCVMTGQEGNLEGIISGYSDYTFRPGSTLNRAEASKMVARALEETLD